MRAEAAAFPEPCSATTSTGTSFCDNSRITASTVRIPALTLSTHTQAPPFRDLPCELGEDVRISLLSSSMFDFGSVSLLGLLLGFVIARPSWEGVLESSLCLYKSTLAANQGKMTAKRRQR